jgi:2,4-dienoyl-CoA reductase-like NADH-dependent reductase (Old Yellow Enzyme family)
MGDLELANRILLAPMTRSREGAGREPVGNILTGDALPGLGPARASGDPGAIPRASTSPTVSPTRPLHFDQ